jgi:exosortase D (VPLPA-CTERM-specific)
MHGTGDITSAIGRLPIRLAGLLWLFSALAGAFVLFWPGLELLWVVWQTPEYSHGPLIPILSGLLFLRQLKGEPIIQGPVNRWPGLILMVFSVLLGLAGQMVETPTVTATALVPWFGSVLLICFGWDQGKRFWPPIVHLLFMLPLPGYSHYKVSIALQLISAELGVWILRLMNIPVFLDGYIIDLGVLKMHVAEACSGLRYLFPILSFSYIFAVLFQGGIVMKTILLLSAAPIAVAMNSVRIAIAGVIVQYQGKEHLEGFTHFFEGWVIFVLSVLLMFLLARLLLVLRRDRITLIEALDLDFSGISQQARRIGLVEPSPALMALAATTIGAAVLWHTFPTVRTVEPPRAEFASFPVQIGTWTGGPQQVLDGEVARVLQAQDYVLSSYSDPAGGQVEVFAAWFRDQTISGAHSPEVCLPTTGWEFASFDRRDVGPAMGLDKPFLINRAIIQKGEERMMVYYYFVQNGRQVAWDFGSKLWLFWDSVVHGRKDGGLVRLVTVIPPGETEAVAERRLQDMARELDGRLERFFPGRE